MGCCSCTLATVDSVHRDIAVSSLAALVFGVDALLAAATAWKDVRVVQAYNSSHPHYQPALQKHLRSQGAEFDNHYVTTPVCCPSRTNILFGKYSHNTNMTDVFPPHGTVRPFRCLAVVLQLAIT